MFSICNKHETHISTAFCPLCRIAELTAEVERTKHYREEAVMVISKVADLEAEVERYKQQEKEQEQYLLGREIVCANGVTHKNTTNYECLYCSSEKAKAEVERLRGESKCLTEVYLGKDAGEEIQQLIAKVEQLKELNSILHKDCIGWQEANKHLLVALERIVRNSASLTGAKSIADRALKEGKGRKSDAYNI